MLKISSEWKIFPSTYPIGQHYFPKDLVIRIAAGAWGCTCFFLVQIYCCTLISHLTSPNQKLIVNSFFDIADTPGVSLTIDRDYALDKIMQVFYLPYRYNYIFQQLLNPDSNQFLIFFLQITESAYVKRFVDTLKKDHRFITCNMTSDCLDCVKKRNAVYSAVSAYSY